MRLRQSLLILLPNVAAGFYVATPFRSPHSTTLQSTLGTGAGSVDVTTSVAKTELLQVAEELNDEFGCLIIDSKAKERLRAAVEKLESFADPPSASAGLIGNWTLLCSTASPQSGPFDKINGIDTSKIPFFNEGPLKEIRDTLNKSLKVQQIVKAENSPGIVSRIDHVLQYVPPDTLAAVLNSIPDTLKNLNINPLEVTKSKVVLVHKAEVQSVEPSFNTKLSLSSIVVNVAGKSQVLSPEGADILGINIPFGEFLNAGSFETTYMDDRIRISRSKVGLVEQLRVFVKSELEVTAADEYENEKEVENMVTDADVVEEEEEEDDDDDETKSSNNEEDDDISPSDY